MATTKIANLESPYPRFLEVTAPMADVVAIPIQPLPGVASGTDTQVGYAQ